MLWKDCESNGLLGQGILVFFSAYKESLTVNLNEYRIELPENVEFIINTLNEHGYEAYAVGGCVRDSILHKEPKDWDITTSAKPQEIKACFKRTIDTGILHGTVTVMIGNTGYEVTTYRIDGEYADGRHPDSVEFSASLTEDLKRRDFTINAMAYNNTDGLVDEFDGIEDMENGIIRCVRNPYERFTEDALRMMRAVRFSAQLGFYIEDSTFDAIHSLAPNISKVSHERIQVELTKTLLSDNPDYIMKFNDTGIFDEILPVFKKVCSHEAADMLMEHLKKTEKNTAVRYAAVLYPMGAQAAEEELRNLRMDNGNIALVKKIITSMAYGDITDEISMRRFLNIYGTDFWQTYKNFMEVYYTGKAVNMLVNADNMYHEIISRGDCVNLKNLAVNGKDLIAAGIKPGTQLGSVLSDMLEEVIGNPAHNDKEWLLNHFCNN